MSMLVESLTNYELRKYLYTAKRLGMSCLVEVHNNQELDIALQAGAEIIGINNRDLTTFKVSLETTLALAPRIPPHIPIISESGFKTREEIQKMRGIVDTVLRTSFMKSADIEKMQEFGLYDHQQVNRF